MFIDSIILDNLKRQSVFPFNLVISSNCSVLLSFLFNANDFSLLIDLLLLPKAAAAVFVQRLIFMNQ